MNEESDKMKSSSQHIRAKVEEGISGQPLRRSDSSTTVHAEMDVVHG